MDSARDARRLYVATLDQIAANRIAANLIINELIPRLNAAGIEIDNSPVPTFIIAGLAKMKHEGKVDTHSIRKILDRFFDTSS
jgi:Asp-tRNA(Asn)/Glu-tRNA(Gln) amidotransferase B subunit